MSDAKLSFEVQTYNNGRWAINSTLPSEEAARRKATELLGQKQIAGVRIIKESTFGSGNRRESEIFSKLKEVEEKDDFTIVSVDNAPFCKEAADYYKTAARAVMGRMLSKYLEKVEMTPFEIMHNHSSMKRLLNLDSLMSSAVDKIAGIQARMSGENARARRDILFAAVDSIGKRAREAESKDVPELKNSTLDELLKRLDAKIGDEGERQFLANVALAKVSIGWQGWIGKMTGLLPLARSQQDERALAMIDESIADILVARTSVKDVIGISRHMGDAIMRILDLIEGKCTPTKFAAVDLVVLLNALLAEGKLPRSKGALIDRIERDMTSAAPLIERAEGDAEKDFFKLMLARIVTDQGVVGGHPVATGLADRWARLCNMGGKAGRRNAMEGLLGLLESGRRKFVYLLALYDKDADADFRGAVEIQIRNFVAQNKTIKALAPSAKTQTARLQEVAAIQKLVLESDLDPNFKGPIADGFDMLVSDYIISENVIERLDDAQLSFRDRAIRLVRFSTSGVLTVGRATTIARERITAYLKRHDFISEFTAGITDPAEQAKVITDFYALLTTAGFSPRS